MARINIDDDFWEMIEAVTTMTGDYDKTLAQAMRLIRLSQQRFKEGRIIKRSEYDARGFYPQFIGIFMTEIEKDSLQYIHAEKEFNWLLDRRKSGQKGGKASGEARRRDSDDLARSKTEANSSKPNPLPLTLPLKKLNNNTAKSKKQPIPDFDRAQEACTLLIASALKKYGDWASQSSEVKGMIGEQLFAVAIKANTSELRRIPEGPFRMLNMIKRLREAYDSIQK